MEIKLDLNRNEVLDIYNNLKAINLKGASSNMAHAIIMNQIILRSDALDIIAENAEIGNRCQTDEWMDLYYKVGAATETYRSFPTQENNLELNSLYSKFRPIDITVAKKQNALKDTLFKKNTYSYSLLSINIDELVSLLQSQDRNFNYTEIESITKLLEK